MKATKIASTAAVAGGGGWLAKVALIWVGGGSAGLLVGLMSVLGLTGLVVALAASGYALVTTAPIWLRVLVSVSFPVLVVLVWLVLDSAIRSAYARDTWLRDEITVVLAAAVALPLGLWGWNRTRATAPARKHSRGHHLAR